MNLIGTPVTSRTERAAPPRASPSILVRIRPVMPTCSLNSAAARTASWPVMASTTSSTSVGCRRDLILATSCIITSSMCSRPAVSRMTVLLFWACACRTPLTAIVDRVGSRRLGVDGHVQLLAERLQLLDGRGAVDVGGHQQRVLPGACAAAGPAWRQWWSCRSLAGRPS